MCSYLKIYKFLKIQDKDIIKKSGLFLYIKEIFIIIFYNISTSLELVNEVRDMIAEIIFNFNNKLSI